jgi:hypothetical protein
MNRLAGHNPKTFASCKSRAAKQPFPAALAPVRYLDAVSDLDLPGEIR